MKKIIALVLSVLLVASMLAFTSCGKEPTAYELISAAAEKNKKDNNPFTTAVIVSTTASTAHISDSDSIAITSATSAAEE